MIYLSPENKWSIPTILDELKDKKAIEFLYRDKLGRIQKGVQHKKLMLKTVFRCGTKCTHCRKEGLHFELNNTYALRIATVDGFLNVEHIIPQSLGGTNIEYNVTIFCDICNTAKGNDLLVPKKVVKKVTKKVVKKVKAKKVKAKKVKKVKKVKAKIDPIFNIHFGKFVKDLLLNEYNDSHNLMHVTFSKLYNSHVSFKIKTDELDCNIETLNYFLCENEINKVVKREDITDNYYDNK